MKTINKILVILSTLIVLSSCGKYEEGTVISFRSPEKRLIGMWEFSSVLIDGTEYISGYTNDSTDLKLSVSGSKDEMFVILVEDNRGSAQLSSSLLYLNDNKTEMTFDLSPSPLYEDITQYFFALIPALKERNTWLIKRLSFDELWITADYQELAYELHLKKTEQYSFNQ
ncbi:hypothetical protein SDC9_52476 [bioreactor metagenome]|uniref:Lipocalin-like domain-containing protein n=1 Tax=bioreactor metagenome TaxID=1076179 RepID=A0A644WQR9_9ZZZZ